MRALFCAAALVACLVPGLSQTKANPSPLTILFRFHGPASDIAFQEMKRELDSLMKPSVYRPEWRNRDELASSENFESLVIVEFHGECRMDTEFRSPERNAPLGRTHLANGVVLPFSEVECDEVRASLGRRKEPALQSNRTLGRALARVLAHELYHILARSPEHASQGVAKRSFSKSDLTSDGFQLYPAQMDRMKPAPAEMPPGSGASDTNSVALDLGSESSAR
jgi:hypothetical protein